MEAIFEQTIALLLKQASGNTAFYENSIYADNLMESTLAPLIDKVMKSNSGVYIKSHPRGEENKPHIEIHLSTMAKENEKPEEKLQQAMTQLSKAIAKVGGKVSAAQQNA
jgi:molybdopterin-biosynthesis enzyme MoeA-like protein